MGRLSVGIRLFTAPVPPPETARSLLALVHSIDLPPFPIERLVLYRSLLLPAGAEHREVHAVPLDSPARPHRT